MERAPPNRRKGNSGNYAPIRVTKMCGLTIEEGLPAVGNVPPRAHGDERYPPADSSNEPIRSQIRSHEKFSGPVDRAGAVSFGPGEAAADWEDGLRSLGVSAQREGESSLLALERGAPVLGAQRCQPARSLLVVSPDSIGARSGPEPIGRRFQ